MSPLSVEYNHITYHQHELQNITDFPYQSLLSVGMVVEYNNLLQSKDFIETFKCSDTDRQSATTWCHKCQGHSYLILVHETLPCPNAYMYKM